MPLFFIQLLFWLFMASNAQAVTFTVNTTVDEVDTNPGDHICLTATGHCSLRAAVQEANASTNVSTNSQGAFIPDVISVPAGTYTLTLSGANENLAATGDLDITDNVEIDGAGSNSTIIDGNNADRIFHIMSGVTDAIISGVAIQHGKVTNSNGGGIENSGVLSLSNCTVVSNVVTTTVSGGGGGGIYNEGDMTVENCTLDSNQVTGSTAAGGGGIETVGVTGIGSNTVKANLIRAIITHNTAPLGGGVRNLFGNMNIDLSTIDSNSADNSGGGVENVGGSIAILNTAITNNVAPQAGAGVDDEGTMDIINSYIAGNSSLGITPPNPPVAGGSGGGIFISGGGAMNLVSTTVTGNTARQGGGVYNHGAIVVTNATIFNNAATSGTGSVNAGSEVYACGNKDESLGLGCDNGITDSNGNFVITSQFVNTIVGNSTTLDNCGGDVTDLITSDGHNIETANTCGFTTATDIPNVSSSSLFTSTTPQYNGSDNVDVLSFAINPSGPAHNNANLDSCPIVDTNGFLRNENSHGACDIGATEISTTKPAAGSVLDLAVTISSSVAAPQNGTVQTTMTFTVANKGPVQATGVVLTGTIPTLSWLKITSLNPGSAGGTCSLDSTGFTCNMTTLEAYKSADFFVATVASQAGSFQVSAEVHSAQTDNFRPDNTRSVTIDIPTVQGSSSGSNNGNFSGGGGTIDWLSLMVLMVPIARRMRRS